MRSDGRKVPLVKSERTLFESTAPVPPSAPPSWLGWYLLAGVLIGAAALMLGAAAAASRKARIGFLAITWTWFIVSGIAGLVLVGLWGFTDHAAAYRNENVLQMDLLVLPLLWLVTRMVIGSGRHSRVAVLLAATVAAISLLGLFLKLFPPFYQVNQSIIALALPAHLGIAGGIWRVALQHQRTLRSASRASG